MRTTRREPGLCKGRARTTEVAATLGDHREGQWNEGAQIDILGEEEQLLRKEARVLCDHCLGIQTVKAAFTAEDRGKIKARLRMLGYIN